MLLYQDIVVRKIAVAEVTMRVSQGHQQWHYLLDCT